MGFKLDLPLLWINDLQFLPFALELASGLDKDFCLEAGFYLLAPDFEPGIVCTA